MVPGPTDQPDVVYAGTEPSALFRSEDGGITFALVDGLWDHPHRPTWYPGFGGQCLHTIVPHPTDADRVLVAMSTGGVYRTEDGGATLGAEQHRRVQAPLAGPVPGVRPVRAPGREPSGPPDQMFLQNHHGVYRSDDGGASWQSIADGLPADFGFPVVVHPHRPGHRVPLPAPGRRRPHATGPPVPGLPH